MKDEETGKLSTLTKVMQLTSGSVRIRSGSQACTFSMVPNTQGPSGDLSELSLWGLMHAKH